MNLASNFLRAGKCYNNMYILFSDYLSGSVNKNMFHTAQVGLGQVRAIWAAVTY